MPDPKFKFFKITLPMIMTASSIALLHTAPNIQKAYAAQMFQPGLHINPKTGIDTTSMMKEPPANAKCFMGDLVKAAAENRSMTIWGMYPASIRGRILSRNATEINDPMMSTSSFSGGGW